MNDEEMEKQVKQDKVTAEVLEASVRKVAGTREGKELLNWFLGITNIYHTSFTGNSTTFYNEGRRSVGLELLDMLDQIDPNIYINILKENARKIK